MKNYFTNITEKVKDFFSNSTPATKIKYGVISLLTVAIVASLIVVVAMNTSEPETPSVSDETKNGEAATIDFDSEIVIDIGEDSEASSKTETSKTETDSATDTNDPTKDTTETASESSSNKVTEKEPADPTTESSGDEPMPSDPSTSVSNVDPQPIDTTKQTQTTAKQTQAETRPAETTAKQTQAVTKPAETTAKQTQAVTKPVETTKAEDSNPQTSGQFVLKEKKYDYNGANVSILQVENKSQTAYTITITGKFKDASGKVLKTESKTFEGFPGGWSNYFVFQPGVKYSSVTWGMETVEYTDETVAQCLYHGDKVTIGTSMGLSDGSGEFIYPSAERPFDTLTQYVTVFAYFHPIYCENISRLTYSAEFVVFDTNEEICLIDRPGKKIDFYLTKDNPYTQSVIMFVTDVLWENKENYTLPNNLKNISGIMSITSISK